DPVGRRIMKVVYPKSAPGVINTEGITKTYYVRDAQGNVMSIYTLKTEDSEKNLYLRERMLYGSTRLGMEQVNQIVASTEPTNIDINTAQQRVVGDKRYEMQNHLNSVMVTVTDRKLPEYNATENLAYYKPDVVSYSDYSPFGVTWRDGGETGRYGFQGQEQVPELKGEGRDIHFTYRDYDPDIGRMKSVDPLASQYPFNSPYAFSENNVIHAIELEGLEKIEHWAYNGDLTLQLSTVNFEDLIILAQRVYTEVFQAAVPNWNNLSEEEKQQYTARIVNNPTGEEYLGTPAFSATIYV